MENLSQKQIDYSIAKERVKQLKKIYSSLAVFIIVFTIYCFRKYYYTGEIPFLETNHFSIVFCILGIILAIKAIKIFFLNQDWERKMMDKELNQNRNGNF